jgi:hypothetical protein
VQTNDPEYTRRKVREFLAAHTVYELIPESGKVVLLDSALPIRQAFHEQASRGAASRFSGCAQLAQGSTAFGMRLSWHPGPAVTSCDQGLWLHAVPTPLYEAAKTIRCPTVRQSTLCLAVGKPLEVCYKLAHQWSGGFARATGDRFSAAVGRRHSHCARHGVSLRLHPGAAADSKLHTVLCPLLTTQLCHLAFSIRSCSCVPADFVLAGFSLIASNDRRCRCCSRCARA